MGNAISEFIYKGEHSKVLLFKMNDGDLLKAHRATVDVMLIVSKGTMEVEKDNKFTELTTGEYIFFNANEMHSVKAIGNLEFCLIKLAPHG